MPGTLAILREGYGKVRMKKPNAWGLYDMHGKRCGVDLGPVCCGWISTIPREDGFEPMGNNPLRHTPKY